MSEMAKAARAAMKKKAASMSAGDPRAKVDASSWTPPEMMNTEAKTGLRPVSRRAFKKGGKVVACTGEDAKHHAGKKPRKATGGEAAKYANAKVNRNVKDANAELGKPHVGGYASGGYAKGGSSDVSQDKKLIKKAMRQHETAQHGGKHSPLKLKKGGKSCYADGGEVDPRDVIKTPPKPAPMPTQEENDRYNRMEAARIEAERLRKEAEEERKKQYAPRKSGGRTKKEGGGDVSGIMKRLQNLQDKRRGVDLSPTSESGEPLFGGAKESALRTKRKEAALKAAEIDDEARRGPSGEKLLATTPERYRSFRSKKPFQPKELSVRDKLMNKIRGVDEDDNYARGGKTKKSHSMSEGGGNYTGGTRPTGGRIARKDGGRAKKKKGTHINIVINAKPESAPGMPPNPMGAAPMPPRPPMMPPGPPPVMPGPSAAPPMPMPPSGGPMGAPPGGPQLPPHLAAMMGRKSGGRVGHRGYKSYKDMDAGAGSGLGRLEKTEIQEHKPRKAGGRTYRSYKDMDAGAGSGLGRKEKTEIQKHK